MDKNTASSIAIKGFTGAVVLAGATQAYGSVVMVTPPPNITGTGSTGEATTTWDVNGDGTADFVFGAGAANIGGSKYLAYTGINAYSGGMVGYLLDGAYNYASNLKKGTTIGPASYFVKGTYLTTIEVKYGTEVAGQFPSGKTTGYLGFDFTAADGTHYGYIELSDTLTSTAKASTSSATLDFVEAFYDTTPGEAITIGGAVPEPSSVAALAFGAAGVAGALAYRRKRAA